MSYYNRITVALAAIAALAAMLLASPNSHAEPGVKCETVLWGFLGGQRRTICDTPKRANGEWMRERTVWTPKYYVPFRCTYGTYSSTCYGGYWVDQSVQTQEVYPVNDGNVLPDEPGNLTSAGVTA
ncbi:hypothetical protein [Mycobacteroides franklinii]|uniref:CDGP domain-containing protein n=1 Tax=Mycobacteroides franklinii TaxID=948102 RepID=UPI00099451DD|nr:hypothetical protein [Mycobacteroides franklinii]ORA64136.1 hypothetical protein BST24_02940 [Mycobacteroides franklinii]